MNDALELAWPLLGLDEPTLRAASLSEHERAAADELAKSGVFALLPPAESAPCSGCGCGSLLPVHADPRGLWVYCPACGPSSIDPDDLRRWQLDSTAFVGAIANAACHASVWECLPRRLWRLGPAKIAGRSRELWLAIGSPFHPDDAPRTEIASRPGAVVLYTDARSSDAWERIAPGRAFLAASVFRWNTGNGLAHDPAVLEAALGVANPRPNAPAAKRGERAAQIDRLEEAVANWMAATRQFFARGGKPGDPLARLPAKWKFAELAGLTAVQTSRCFNDPNAKHLRWLWDQAEELVRK